MVSNGGCSVSGMPVFLQNPVDVDGQIQLFLLGDLVEFGKTEQIFSTPSDKRTEDYITGRFG